MSDQLWDDFVKKDNSLDTPELRKVLDDKAIKIWKGIKCIDDNDITVWLFENNGSAYSYYTASLGKKLYYKSDWTQVDYAKELKDCFEGKVVPSLIKISGHSVDLEPKNNDGRDTCYWCNATTRQINGFLYSSIWKICSKCGR